MKLDLIIEKNVVIKRDKPWLNFHHLTDHDLVCYNDQKKFEVVDSSNGKLEHLPHKHVSAFAKSSIAYGVSNNGQFFGFLSSTYEVTLWDKTKSIRTIPSCLTAMKAVKSQPLIFISNTGDQVILILKKPFRMFLWLKSIQTRSISSLKTSHKSPICSNIGSRANDDIGNWEEISLNNAEQLRILNDDQHEFSIDVFFRSKQSLATCALVYFDSVGFIQLNRIEIDWKSTIYAEQPILYSLEIFQIPLTVSGQLNSIRFAHSSPILAISISTYIVFISLTTIHFSRAMPINCSITTNSPTHQSPVLIKDFIWSFDDQFVIGLTNRGAVFFLNRFGCQINLMTTGECIAQGPSSFVIIHPLIGKDSEATTHLGLESFMRSIVAFSKDDKTKQQQFSITMETGKPVFYCSDGYRLARLTYSDRIRDRRLYDPLLYLHVLDVNQQQQSERSIFLQGAKSFEDLPKIAERFDTESLGRGGVSNNLNRLSKYGSLTSLAMEQQTGDITLDELFSAYQLLFTSPNRLQHDHCLSLERTTKSLLLSTERPDLLTSEKLSHYLTNLLLSSSFGSLTFLHLSCLTNFIPLFIEIFQKQTTMGNDPDLFHLCLLYLMEQWLQAVLYLPTKPNTFELCRRQRVVPDQNAEDDAPLFFLCKGIRQLELLQGTKVNLDEFLASAMPRRLQTGQEPAPYYHRITLLRSWYQLWSSIERKYFRESKIPPKFVLTIRLFLQSLLSSYPSLNASRLSSYGYEIDLNDLFPPPISGLDHPLNTKGYTTLNERRKQRRRSRNVTDQTPSARSSHRKKPATESRKALGLHRLLYALLEQYQIRDAVCILNVALRRETSVLSSCLPLDLFSINLFQHIDTRTHFGLPGHALRSVLRTLARFMARAMIIGDPSQEELSLFVYSVDSANPLPNLFKVKETQTEYNRPRMIYLDRKRLNLAVEQQKMSKFWQPLKVLELFVLGQSPNEAVLFSKLIGDWRTAVSLASVLPSDKRYLNSSHELPPSPLTSVTSEALLYSKLCEYLQIDNLKGLLKRSYKQDEIVHFIQNLSSTLEQFLLCATLLHIPLTEKLFQRLNGTIIYLFTLLPTFISPKYYLPCPPIYSTIMNTYDDEKNDISCKYETHLRLILYRTIHIFIELLSASRIQLSCFKWYFDYLTAGTTSRRKTTADEPRDSFHPIRLLLKSLRFHKLPNIPHRILIYFRDFCVLLFMLDVRDRLCLTLRQYLREKLNANRLSDQLAWKAIGYGTILLSFRCLLSDEMILLRTILNLFFDLPPSEKLMEALARLIVVRQYGDDDQRANDEVRVILEQLKAKWVRINPTFLQIYDGYLQTIVVQDVQGDIIRNYMTDAGNPREEPLLDLNPKWFERWGEFGEFMSMLVPNLLDTSSLSNLQQQDSMDQHSKFDSKSIPLLQTMSDKLRELELPISLDKRYILKQPPTFVPPHEYVVFPVRVVQSNNPHTMFQQAPTSVNHNSVGSFVQSSDNQQQPPDVVSLEHHHQRTSPMTRTSPIKTTSDTTESEWDGRSDDPQRMSIRNFDPPYDVNARQALWVNGWANRDFNTASNERIQTNGIRIPTNAQFLAASGIMSDPQAYQSALRQNSQQHRDQLENDTDLTSVTKESDDEDGNRTHSDIPSSPHRRETPLRKNSLEESMSLHFSNDGVDYSRGLDFRAPSRDTGGDESPSYDIAHFPTEYYKGPTGRGSPYRSIRTPPTQMSPPTSNGFQQQLPLLQPSTLRSSVGSRKFMDDSDPNNAEKLAKEDREKYTIPETTRTATSKSTANGYHSPTRDSYRNQASSPDESARRSPSRRLHSHRSSRRERHHHKKHSPSRDQTKPYEQQYFPQIQPPSSFADYSRAASSMQYAPAVRLPLLRLGGPSFIGAQNAFVHPRFAVTPISTAPTTSIVPIYIPVPPRPPLPSLHLAPQLPPPASLSPRATRADQQKFSVVQNIMQQYVGQHRPRLQLLQLRHHPELRSGPDLNIPMPAPNVVMTSTDTKVDKDIQVEVPRQDGFVIEPGLFQNLLRDATGVNFTSAEAHYSAARQIQQQALEARKRERSTMTDQPAHQILYDLQYARGGDGDERKFVNVTDIDGSHVDALLTQIHRDQTERERLRQQQPIPPPVPMVNSIHDLPAPTNDLGFGRQNEFVMRQGQYPLGFDQQNTEVSRQPPSARLGFGEQESQVLQEQRELPLSGNSYETEEMQRRSEIILQRRRQREEEEKQSEKLAFGHIDETNGDLSSRRVTYEPHVTTHEFDESDVPLEYLIRQTRIKELPSNNNAHQSNPPSARSTTTATPRSPRKKAVQEPPPISIKTTTPRDPFSPRRTQSLSSRSTVAGTPRKTTSPTIADRHREARQLKQQALARQREANALRIADATLHGEHLPPSHALDEFDMEALETSFTSTVRELGGIDGFINRTYDLDLLDNTDDVNGLYSERIPSRPMSAATTSNLNQSGTQYSVTSSTKRRPSSASSGRSSRTMTAMGRAIMEVKKKGPPPARSNMARKRPMSSPGNLGQKRGSMTAPARTNQNRTRMVPNARKASPPSHKPTTYNERVRALNKTDGDITKASKTNPTDPKALMRLYGTRRVPGLYKPYEKVDQRVVNAYSERMRDSKQPDTIQLQRRRSSQGTEDQDLDARPSSAPSSSISLSDWEVDERVKHLMYDDLDSTSQKRFTTTVTPLPDLDELVDDEEDLNPTTYSLTRVTEQTNENTYGDDLRLLQYRRPSTFHTNTYGGTRASARSSAGGDMTARDESELSRGENSIDSVIDWSLIDRDYAVGTQ